MAREPQRIRRRERKNITSGVAHVNAPFNNTMITITDAQGHAISWSSAGTMGFKGNRKYTPYAEMGRAAGRGIGCQYGWSWVVAVAFKKKIRQKMLTLKEE